MSADVIDLEERRRLANPDRPVVRVAASRYTLAERVRQVSDAFKARDEDAARYELRELAREADMLAGQRSLWR